MAHEQRTTEPHDRLTRLCAAMTETMDAHPEYRAATDRCIVFLDDGKRGGIQIHGYESDGDAMVDLLLHLKAIFAANGTELILAPLAGNPEEN